MKDSITWRSTRRNCLFPGNYVAARELGVNRVHLHRVLIGERESKALMSRWNEWLDANPDYKKANRKLARKQAAARKAARRKLMQRR